MGLMWVAAAVAAQKARNDYYGKVLLPDIKYQSIEEERIEEIYDYTIRNIDAGAHYLAAIRFVQVYSQLQTMDWFIQLTYYFLIVFDNMTVNDIYGLNFDRDLATLRTTYTNQGFTCIE